MAKTGRRQLPALAAALFAATAPPGATAASVSGPEPITLTESQLQTPEGQAVVEAQAALREGEFDNIDAQLERARELVGLTVAACGADDINVSRAVNNLALLQADSGDYAAAVQNFRAAITAREKLQNTFVETSLVNPILGLADTLVAIEAEDDAIELYERAIHITHVNDGPGNVAQVPIIDALAETYERIGSRSEASRLANLRFRLLARHYEPASDQYLDALEHRARWAARFDNDSQASYAYTRLIEHMGERFGEDSPLLIDPLMDFAIVSIGRRSGRYARTEQSLLQEARRAIKRAEDIARSHVDDNPTITARMLARKGDWMQYIGSPRLARDVYAEAWSLLSASPELLALRAELFGAPRTIYKGEIYRIYDRPETMDVDPRRYPLQGFVAVSYQIDEAGKPTAITVTDSEPAGLMEEYVTTRLMSYIYRPEFRNGNPVPHRPVQTYRHEFRYNPELLTLSERELIRRSEAQRQVGATKTGNTSTAGPNDS